MFPSNCLGIESVCVSRWWLVLWMVLMIAVLGADAYSHPSERCAELVPDRERRDVANQLEFMDAILNPEVGCILFTNTIEMDHQTWGADGPLFRGKECVRFSWPFCSHQLLTHTVVVAPAPGLTAEQAEWHFAPGMFYVSCLQFTATGKIITVGMRLIGVHDASVAKLAMGRDILTDNEISFDWDRRPFISGNTAAENVTGFVRCGAEFQETIVKFGLDMLPEVFANNGVDFDLDLGYAVFRWAQFALDVERPYVIDNLAATVNDYVNFTFANFTMQCCEAPKCLGEGCETHCITPERTQVQREGPVVYGDMEYILVTRTAQQARAEADCQSKYSSGLASFRSLAEFYTVTKALFTTNDGFVLMQVGLPIWVSNNQSEALAHHRMMRNASVVSSAECTVVQMTPQLLDSHGCDDYFPSICMRPIASSGIPSLPPSSLGPASNSTKRQPDDVFGAMPIELGVSIVVVLGMFAVLLTGVVVWRNFRKRKRIEMEDSWDGIRGTGASVYAMSSRSVLKRRELPLMSSGLEVEGEHGNIRMTSIAAMVKSQQIVLEHAEANAHGIEEASECAGPSNKRRSSLGNASVYSQRSSQIGTDPEFPEIEGYEVIKALGAGTYGECYLVRDNTSQDLFAAKVPLEDSSLVKVVQEAYFLQMFKDNNIVGHRHTLVRKGKLVLMTEFCDCGDLHSLMAAGTEPLSERFVRHALLQCAMGLACMHSHHVAHRDVKPSNILLTSKGVFKLADLGASCMIVDASHTTLVGTPLFMAPEVLSGKPQDVQTDVYSLGCVAYLMCMLKYPYTSHSLSGLATQVQLNDYEKIPDDAYSKNLIQLIDRMLSKDASSRPTSFEICETEWLFDFCHGDSDQFLGMDGAFHREVHLCSDVGTFRNMATEQSSGYSTLYMDSATN
mmetsp:Transcript_43367/g.81281  ORF Transcript_43367/g.81281 Transcript_43367/m.81281 type:complete len:903 (-) Transcript_43367:287-2995(-)